MKKKAIYLLALGLVGCASQTKAIDQNVSKDLWLKENKNGKPQKYLQNWLTKSKKINFYKKSPTYKKDELLYKNNQYLDAYKLENKNSSWKPYSVEGFINSKAGRKGKLLWITNELKVNCVYDECKKSKTVDFESFKRGYGHYYVHTLKYGSSIFEKHLSYVQKSDFWKIPDMKKKINSFKDSAEFLKSKNQYGVEYKTKESIVLKYKFLPSGVMDSWKWSPPTIKIPSFPSGFERTVKSSEMDYYILEWEKTSKGKEGLNELWRGTNIFETKNPSKYIVRNKSFAEQYYDKWYKKTFYQKNSLSLLFATSLQFNNKLSQWEKSKKGKDYLENEYLDSDQSTSDWKKDTK